MKPVCCLLAMLCLLLLGCSRHDPCLVSGTLYGWNNEPMPVATVQLFGGFVHPGRFPGLEDTLVTQTAVGRDGRFSLTVPEEGAFRLVCVGAGHTVFDIPLVIDGERQLDLNVRLHAATPYANAEKLTVDYAFDNGPLDSSATLSRLPDGSFETTLKPTAGFVRFAAGRMLKRVYDAPSFWGTEGEHFEILPDGRYASYVRAGADGTCHLRIPGGADVDARTMPTVIFADSTATVAHVAEAILGFRTILRLHGDSLLAHLRSGGSSQTLLWDWPAKVKEINRMRTEAPAGSLRDELSMELLEIARSFPAAVPSSFLVEAVRSIDATSPLWVYHGSLPLFAHQVLGAGSSFASEVIARHPSENYRAYLLFTEATDCEMRGRHQTADSLMGCLYRSYRKTKVGGNFFIWSTRNHRLAPYSYVPDFCMVSLDDPAVTFTNDTFRGKILLIDFWNTTCSSCIAQMKSLHELYNRYHAKGLEVLSVCIGDSSQAVRKFRATRWPMPWCNTVVPPEKQAEVIMTLGGTTPSMILADTSGIVLGAEAGDTRAYLDSALATLL